MLVGNASYHILLAASKDSFTLMPRHVIDRFMSQIGSR